MEERRQNKNRIWRKMGFWLFLAAVISGISTWRQSRIELENVVCARTDGAYIYGVESRQEGQYLFQVPVGGGASKLEFQPAAGQKDAADSLVPASRERGFADMRGDIYVTGADGRQRKIFSNDGVGISRKNAVYYFGEDSVTFRNLDSHVTYEVPYEGGDPRTIPDEKADAAEAYGHLASLHQRDELGSLYTVYGEGNRLYPVWAGEETVVFGELLKPWEILTKIFGKTAAVVLALGLILECGYRLVIKLSKGVFPTSVKIICTLVPLAAVGCVLMIYQLTGVFVSRFYSQEKAMVYYAAEMLAGDMAAGQLQVNWDNPGFFAEREREALGALWADSGMAGIEEHGRVQVDANLMEGFFYREQGGDFYLLEQGQLMHVPVEYTYMRGVREALARCTQEKRTVTETLDDAQKGRSLNAFAPILDKDGEAAGIVQVSLDTDDIKDAVAEKTVGIAAGMILFLTGIIVMLLLIVVPSLRPLKKMRLAAETLSQGEQGAYIRVWGSQEVAEILQMFNFMVENLNRYLKRIQGLREAYEPFVPQRMVELLGKEDIRGVEPGDRSEFRAEVLIFKETDEAAVSFQEINGSLKHLVSGADAYGGWVESFRGAGARVFFAGDNGASVEAAIEIHRKLGGFRQKFHAGISSGDVCLRAVGARVRMEETVSSRAQELSAALCGLAAEYGIGILAERSVLEASGRKFKERVIGYLRLWDGAEIAVCEVYDADMPAQIRLKNETRSIFEYGAEMFRAGEWREARDCFARVLRKNREDLAASRYFSLCDKRLEAGETGETARYFEELQEIRDGREAV